MKELPKFDVYCKDQDCKSEKIHGTEGKTYFIEKVPQKMIFFNCFGDGWFSREYHQQYYCPSCLAVKTMVTNRKGELIGFYEYGPDEEEYEDCYVDDEYED